MHDNFCGQLGICSVKVYNFLWPPDDDDYDDDG